MASKYAENPFTRWLPWIGAFVLLAGIVAFGVTYVGGDDADPVSQAQPQGAQNTGGEENSQAARKSVPFSPAARKVAAEFLQTAVPRENLRRSWDIVHPEMKQGYTLKDWLTGTIPVQFYPTQKLDLATFKIDESYANEAVIEVALLPKKGSGVKPQIFFVGLKKHKGKWLVNYFAPRSAIAVPQATEGF
jgi:hypothetical protein